MRKVRSACALLVLAMAPMSAAVGETLSGVDLLSSPFASFPSQVPKVAGTSIYFEWGIGAGTPLMNLVRFQVPPGATVPSTGDVVLSATWNVTRLSCLGFCAPAPEDFDPSFMLSDGTTMLGFGLGDNNGGQLVSQSDFDLGPAGLARTLYSLETGTGFPAIGDAFDVELMFTLHDAGTDARIKYLGIERTWSFAQTLSRSGLSLVLGQDNDPGERYQVNSLRLPDAEAVPIPPTAWLVLGAIVCAAFTRRSLFR